MRSAWLRYLLSRTRSIPPARIPRSGVPNLEVRPQRPFSSFAAPLAFFPSSATNTLHRGFASETASEPGSDGPDDVVSVTGMDSLDPIPAVPRLIETLSASDGPDDIVSRLDSFGPTLSHAEVIGVLGGLKSRPDAAKGFFSWVSEREPGKLSSISYNWMLQILGCSKSHLKDFWDLIWVMQKKGFGISKSTLREVGWRFKEEGLERDLKMFEKLCRSNSSVNSIENPSRKVLKIVRDNEWDEATWKKLEDSGVELSPELVEKVVECLDAEKGLKFVERSGFDRAGYATVGRVLAKQDGLDGLWDFVREKRSTGSEMGIDAFRGIVSLLFRRDAVEEAVKLYEFVVSGRAEHPEEAHCSYLLSKIVVREDLDLDLVSRVTQGFVSHGGSLKLSIFQSVGYALMKVGRLDECCKVWKAMEVDHHKVDLTVYGWLVRKLCKAGRLDKARELVAELEIPEDETDYRYRKWKSLVELIKRHSVSDEVDEASSEFRKLVERHGVENNEIRAFEKLVEECCRDNKAEHAYKLLIKMVNEQQLCPSWKTYKILVKNLLGQRRFEEALELFRLMKRVSPSSLDPFIQYIVRYGTADEATALMKAMSGMYSPSITVFLWMFRELLVKGKHHLAQEFLSKSPGHVRQHADVLNLFYSMRTEEPIIAELV
ncbi:hypothetical protein QJS04_geneDACA016475 [Acorus gramineus]|uniref:Pentatricopeptide repeat-containing protein n=1 Tax=Acorus gramineus TaxID=55184 RepID=A0AAV9B7M4_ACOGR|nr:hypothetical protein QJS04_geneDACA016475 [Acorus gramineus]